MLSKTKIKLINSLNHKKYRDETGFFVAEGTKSVSDISQHFELEILFATQEWADKHNINANEIIIINEVELKKISSLKTPQKVLAVFKKSKNEYNAEEIKETLSLVLDNVQDPGNLGTIVRIADWFGIKNIFCSPTTADVFNPKTIQATMGAIGRVKIYYVDLLDFIKQSQPDFPVYGTFLDGENIYKKQLSQKGFIVMGNEGNGISPEIESLINERLFIPSFPPGEETSESLNVAVATAVVCSEFRRNI